MLCPSLIHFIFPRTLGAELERCRRREGKASGGMGRRWGGDSKASQRHHLSEDTSRQATSSASWLPNMTCQHDQGGLHPRDGIKVTRAPRHRASPTAKYKQTAGDAAAVGQDGGTWGPASTFSPFSPSVQALHQGGQRAVGKGSDGEGLDLREAATVPVLGAGPGEASLSPTRKIIRPDQAMSALSDLFLPF